MRTLDYEMTPRGRSFVLRSRIHAGDLAIGGARGDGDRPAADTAVLDVVLMQDGAIHENLYLLPAIRALDKNGLELVHACLRMLSAIIH